MYDLDSCPKHSSIKTSDHIQLVDNPLFEVVADWTSDNPLFVVYEGIPFDFHEEDDFDFKILDLGTVPSSEYGSQDGGSDLTTIAGHWISPNMVFYFTSYRR